MYVPSLPNAPKDRYDYLPDNAHFRLGYEVRRGWLIEQQRIACAGICPQRPSPRSLHFFPGRGIDGWKVLYSPADCRPDIITSTQRGSRLRLSLFANTDRPASSPPRRRNAGRLAHDQGRREAAQLDVLPGAEAARLRPDDRLLPGATAPPHLTSTFHVSHTLHASLQSLPAHSPTVTTPLCLCSLSHLFNRRTQGTSPTASRTSSTSSSSCRATCSSSRTAATGRAGAPPTRRRGAAEMGGEFPSSSYMLCSLIPRMRVVCGD